MAKEHKYAPNVTMEQFEAQSYNRAKKTLSNTRESSSDRAVARAYSLLQTVLMKNGIHVVPEDGEFWVKTAKADLSTLHSEGGGEVTTKILQVHNRNVKRVIRRIVTDEVYEWVCVGFADNQYYVWQHEKELFTGGKSELGDLVDFLKGYFSSKYTNGKLVYNGKK